MSANNRIGHGVANITPTRTDPTPGSGSPAVREAWLDGQWVYPLPLDASKLSLGKHTWTLHITDSAGNGNKVTFTFLVTTSIADLDALLAKLGDGEHDPRRHRHRAARAGRRGQDANDAGDKVAAVNAIDAFRGSQGAVGHADARNTLSADAQDVIRQLRGIPDAPAPSRPRRHAGRRRRAAPRHLYVPPSAPVRNANPAFKVLVFSNRAGDGSFRHPAIEDAEVMIQELGRQNNFDVDVWDPQYPGAGPAERRSPAPRTSAQYKVIIGDSSVGNSVLNTAYRMKDGTVVNEQPRLPAYIQAGGGYIASTRPTTRCTTGRGTRTSSAACSFATRPTRAASARLRQLLLGRGHQRGPVAPVDGRRGRPEGPRSRTSCTTSTASRACSSHPLQRSTSRPTRPPWASAPPAQLENGDHPIV